MSLPRNGRQAVCTFQTEEVVEELVQLLVAADVCGPISSPYLFAFSGLLCLGPVLPGIAWRYHFAM